MKPTKVKKTGTTELQIEWDDGHKGKHSLQNLRKYCPCAGCKSDMEAHEGMVLLPVLTPGKNELQAIEQVGNYALQLKWADGHSTGIYTYDHLRQLCECDECLKTAEE